MNMGPGLVKRMDATPDSGMAGCLPLGETRRTRTPMIGRIIKASKVEEGIATVGNDELGKGGLTPYARCRSMRPELAHAQRQDTHRPSHLQASSTCSARKCACRCIGRSPVPPAPNVRRAMRGENVCLGLLLAGAVHPRRRLEDGRGARSEGAKATSWCATRSAARTLP